MCATKSVYYYKKNVCYLHQDVQVKEIIRSMKNFAIKAMCACGEEVTEKNYY